MTRRFRRQQREQHRHSHASRRGVAALFVLACLSFATVVGTLLMQAVVAERASLSRLAATHQAECLVESGVDRAIAQLSRSPAYPGETWSISAAEWPGGGPASVQIEIKADPAHPTRRRIRAKARLEAGKGPVFEVVKESTVQLVVE